MRIIWLGLGDILALLIFVWIGRRNHALSVIDGFAILQTVAPFVLSWFLVTPWFGLFQTTVSLSWRKLLPRLLLAWVFIGGPLGLVLRNIFLDRPPVSGIIPSFALITLSITTIFLIGWRLGYIWWHKHQQLHQNHITKGM